MSPWPTVLVAGYTGVGKTSLLQSIFGKKLVPDDAVGHGGPATTDFRLYRSGKLRIFDSEGMLPGDDTKESFLGRIDNFVDSLRLAPDVHEHIHVYWYCIQGCGARVTPLDLDVIRTLGPHVLVPLTKADITRGKQLDGLVSALLQGGVAASTIIPVSVGDPKSLSQLMDATSSLMEPSHRTALQQSVESARNRDKKADNIIRVAMMGSVVAGDYAPVPTVVSEKAIVAKHRKMIAKLARLFGQDASSSALFLQSIGTPVKGHGFDDIAQLWLPPNAEISLPIQTYALGEMAKAYWKSGMSLSEEGLRAIFARAATLKAAANLMRA